MHGTPHDLEAWAAAYPEEAHFDSPSAEAWQEIEKKYPKPPKTAAEALERQALARAQELILRYRRHLAQRN